MKKIIILSAPSGSGKTTLLKHILTHFPNLAFSISATTRLPRGKEKHGEDYYFLSIDEFKTKIKQQLFVEYQEVYKNCFYGTLKSEIERIWNLHKTIIFDVDVKGSINLKKIFKKQAMNIFIMPPSLEELEKRLKQRGIDDDKTIKVRLEKAHKEMKYQEKFDKILTNSDLDKAKNEICAFINNFINK